MKKIRTEFKQAVPAISQVAVLVDPARDYAYAPSNIEREGLALGVQLRRFEAGAPEAFEPAFAAMVRAGSDALMIQDSVFFAAYRQRLLELALQYRLPTMSGGHEMAEAGSLLTYGVDVRALCQRSAAFVDKILKGAKPADLPIERHEFHLVINLKLLFTWEIQFEQFHPTIEEKQPNQQLLPFIHSVQMSRA